MARNICDHTALANFTVISQMQIKADLQYLISGNIILPYRKGTFELILPYCKGRLTFELQYNWLEREPKIAWAGVLLKRNDLF